MSVAVPPNAATSAGSPAAAAQASPRTPSAEGRRARVALFGASGYTGQEFARLALSHPGLDLVAIVSREHAGRTATAAFPGWDPRTRPALTFVAPHAVEAMVGDGACDTLVACLPHGAWTAFLAEHPWASNTSLIVDLSSDHRDGRGGYVYGLPEAFRDEIPGTTRLANPGCYPTAASLALMPALEAGWLGGPVTVSALSGVSGAGRSAGLRTSFVELDGGASIYNAGEVHPHVAEMERQFGRMAHGPAGGIDVAFVPHLVPMPRGILLTASAPLAQPLSPEQAHAAYRARYADETFVRVLDPGAWPETRAVRGSNRCDVAVTTVHGGRTLLATAAIDNLVKGAAGQAIQNLNLILGWPEHWGLPVSGTPW